MEKYKKFKKTLIALLLSATTAVGAAAVATTLHPTKVYAADRYVELDGNSVFYTALRTAEITHTEAIETEESDIVKDEDSGETTNPTANYTLFKIGKDEEVSYRQNLAYTWKTAEKDEDGKEMGNVLDMSFSMKLSFNKLNFKRFVVKFQSQQYVCTKEGKTENYLVFEPSEDKENFTLKVCQSLEEDGDGNIKEYEAVSATFTKDERVEISLGERDGGDFALTVNGTVYEVGQLSFKNIGGTFASYVASGDYAVTPIAFSAQGIAEDEDAEMILYSISGQSFQMHNQSGTYKVKDTAAPVMCFSKTPSYLEYGKSLNLSYRVIDVLASSPRATAYYYVLNTDQYAATDYDYEKTDYSASSDSSSGEGDGEDDKLNKDPFTQLSSSSSARIIRDSNTFVPTDYDAGGNKTDKYDNVYGLVKLYYEISDVSGSYKQSDKVFVDWYAVDEKGSPMSDALVDVYKVKNDTDPNKRCYFLKLIDSKKGATYAPYENGITENVYRDAVKDFQDKYQNKINEAIAAMTYEEKEGKENGKLYAGGEKFYLPVFDYAFKDEYDTARDYKYSIYYKAKSTGSATSLDVNKLAFDLNEADIDYTFTVYVTDSMGNPMRYPSTNEDNETEWKEISTSDIWNDEYAGLLPTFTFHVSYKAATATPPEKLSLSYVGTNYSGVDFKIEGVSGTYTSEYKLYIFDRNAVNADMGNINYADFVENVEKLINNEYKDDTNTYKYFTTVKDASSLLETDANYDLFKKVAWDSSDVEFTPQSVDDFYVVELTLTDNASQNKTYVYSAVAPSVQTTPLKGESEWLKNNMTSVVLLCVAGVCLIALIVLLIVKPKDKGDIDVIYSEVEEGDKKDKKKDGKTVS